MSLVEIKEYESLEKLQDDIRYSEVIELTDKAIDYQKSILTSYEYLLDLVDIEIYRN